ncbi:MAG: DNA integrity scanning diadenylate cyclase DisA [Coriobacteriales bacterium]|jgi:diadenylate cyclase|nr:DNA integrity scanning diadenylate cyclase DisA [Coriobacteriales bacterium]
MDKVHAILPQQADNHFDDAIQMVVSGAPLRDAINMIISAQNGALICIGDVDAILMLGNGGFKIDAPFTPQRLFELSKMDGAIVLTDDLRQIVCANFHLSPDPAIHTSETGTRHRSAARTSAQTDAVVIAISKRRVQTTLYCNGEGLTLDSDQILLSKGNQGLLALQNAKNTLERAAMRLSFLELDDIATVADVSRLLARFVKLILLSSETERFINFLGDNSGLLRNQLEEIMSGVVDSFLLIIRDYAGSFDKKQARNIAKALLALEPNEEADLREVLELLGLSPDLADEDHISPRGFRAVSRISMLDEVAVAKIIEEYGSLSAIVSASKGGFDRLESLEDLGVDNVKAIAKSFLQLRSTL